jgi:hypothetical protein
MCGYVCELVFTNDVWGAPIMVGKDCLWDARYEAHDAVLAVHYCCMDRVVLGTYSGLVQVHVPVGTMYDVEWSYRFPDAVHRYCALRKQTHRDDANIAPRGRS